MIKALCVIALCALASCKAHRPERGGCFDGGRVKCVPFPDGIGCRLVSYCDEVQS